MTHAKYVKRFYRQVHKLVAKSIFVLSIIFIFALQFHNLIMIVVYFLALSAYIIFSKEIKNIKILSGQYKKCKIWNERFVLEDCSLYSFAQPIKKTTLSELTKKQFDSKEIYIDTLVDEIDKKAIDDFLLKRNFILEMDGYITIIKKIPNSLGILNKV